MEDKFQSRLQQATSRTIFFKKMLVIKTRCILLLIRVNVALFPSVKHLGMLLDRRLNFNEHAQSKTNKCYNRTYQRIINTPTKRSTTSDL